MKFCLSKFQADLVLDDWGISCAIHLIWMSQGFSDDKSTLVQVIAWCRQATSHYLNQCWPKSKLTYGVIRPYCVNSSWPSDVIWHHRTVKIAACYGSGEEPLWHQAIIWANTNLLSTEPLGTNINILFKTLKFLSWKSIWRSLQNWSHFAKASMF